MRAIVILTSALLIYSCSSTPKSNIDPNANAADEVAALNASIREGYANQYEILANQDFSKAEKYSQEAAEQLREGDSKEDILEDVARGKSHFEKAKSVAEVNKKHLSGVLKSREAVLSTGIRHSQQEKKLEKIDNDLRNYAYNYEKLSAKDSADFEKKYYDLELSMIQKKELAPTIAYFRQAEESGAEKLAPKTYKQTQKDITNAENSIMADRHEPTAYSLSVERALISARNLHDITNKINASRPKINEDAAIQIVKQENEIRNLQGDLGEERNVRDELARTLSTQEQVLSEKEMALAKLKVKEQRQEAISAAQKEFSEEEAEVYQQGDQVLIRLKKINFQPGSAKIPDESKPLLSKVLQSINRLDPAEVKVEGHTDATGSANKNMTLSQKRAEEIAHYLKKEADPSAVFEAVGKGYDKPIATNKTKEGRAQNRRVDLIITPKSSL